MKNIYMMKVSNFKMNKTRKVMVSVLLGKKHTIRSIRNVAKKIAKRLANMEKYEMNTIEIRRALLEI